MIGTIFMTTDANESTTEMNFKCSLAEKIGFIEYKFFKEIV